MENIRKKNRFGNNEKIISAKDERKLVKNTNEFPYSPTGIIKIENFGFKGTGVIIDSNVVLTAAHNLFIKHNQIKVDEIIFIPSFDGQNAYFGEFNVLECYIPEKYKEYENKIKNLKDKNIEKKIFSDEDYAILILDKGSKNIDNLALYTGCYFLKIIKQLSEIKDKFIRIYGYAEVEEKKIGMKEMEMKIGEETIISEGIIKHKIDTSGGQSGSGITVKIGNMYFVFGIHVSTIDHIKYNKGILITEKRLENINKWKIKGFLKYKNRLNNKLIQTFFKPENLSKIKLKNLEKFILNNHNLGFKGMDFLSRIKLDNLKILDLSENNINDKGLDYLSRIKLSNLRELNLKKNSLKASGIKNLIDMDLKNLERLDLSENNIAKKAMFHLTRLKLKQLNELNLNGNDVRNTGIFYLSQNIKNFPNLQILDLKKTLVNKKGLKFFLEMNLQNFRKISYSNDYLKLDNEGIIIISDIIKNNPLIVFDY